MPRTLDDFVPASTAGAATEVDSWRPGAVEIYAKLHDLAARMAPRSPSSSIAPC